MIYPMSVHKWLVAFRGEAFSHRGYVFITGGEVILFAKQTCVHIIRKAYYGIVTSKISNSDTSVLAFQSPGRIFNM